ncbi:MAG: roadblock/LC7 domain-containing protein [Deltaproteobacteria bacterium]|jgi:predicted regulator of Ras-like GTPase activity (Roadblock/LC7/MglB family)|nr:roadblock/LC7 domain-containing protein [Deltaproteobacteria bacterium]MBW2503172.1 roadblock/LC7 domain-containing protein [Deltaproteobacteria bacterium]MBW2518723.1 roadblock/LC7 domain-containing protein [Deltaproteobacteria bacterium]
MPFKTMLNGLVKKVSGAQGAILVDWEGESVEQAGSMDEYELKVLGAHNGVVLRKVRYILKKMSGDKLQELVIATEQAQLIVLPVTDDYSLVLCVDRSECLGRALYESRLCSSRLHREII